VQATSAGACSLQWLRINHLLAKPVYEGFGGTQGLIPGNEDMMDHNEAKTRTIGYLPIERGSLSFGEAASERASEIMFNSHGWLSISELMTYFARGDVSRI
jgi:hypothetical protein